MTIESKLVTAICQELQYYENQKKIYYIRNNTGAIPIRVPGKTRFLRFGKKGSADIIVFLPAKVIFLEVKTEKGKLNKNQKEFKAHIEALGYEYHILRSNRNLKAILFNQ
jgi:hypothetical protein